MRGGITVESSIVIPIVLILVVFVIQSGFYVHDVVAMGAVVYKLSFEDKEFDSTEIQESIKNQMLITQIENVRIEKESDATKIYVCTKLYDKEFCIADIKTNDYVEKSKVVLDLLNDVLN